MEPLGFIFEAGSRFRIQLCVLEVGFSVLVSRSPTSIYVPLHETCAVGNVRSDRYDWVVLEVSVCRSVMNHELLKYVMQCLRP